MLLQKRTSEDFKLSPELEKERDEALEKLYKEQYRRLLIMAESQLLARGSRIVSARDRAADVVQESLAVLCVKYMEYREKDEKGRMNFISAIIRNKAMELGENDQIWTDHIMNTVRHFKTSHSDKTEARLLVQAMMSEPECLPPPASSPPSA